MSKEKLHTASHCGPDAGRVRLRAAFLIAATIDDEGNIDLPAAHKGCPEPHLRAAFSLGSMGEMLQQRYWLDPPDEPGAEVSLRRAEREPLDMVFLGECLNGTLGDLTPRLFRMKAPRRGAAPQFIISGRQSDDARLRLLHEAFNLYLMAYEEHMA